MTKTIPTLTADQIKKALKNYETQIYQAETHIIYEGQVPQVAYLLIDGDISLLKRKKVIMSLDPRQIIGARELLSGVQFNFTAQIKPATEVLIIYKHMLESFFKTINFNFDLPQA